MKLIWLISLIICLKCLKITYGSVESEKKTEKWLIPTIDGTFLYVDEKEAKESFLNSAVHVGINKVFFFLFTNKEQTTGSLIELNNTQSLEQSGFNPNNPTRIIIHGWRNSVKSEVNELIRNAYLTIGNYNVICVDWSAQAKSINYAKVRYSVDSIGELVAEFIDFLRFDGKMQLKDLIVIAHSLGAHIAGIAGQHIKSGKIPIIYGLDPAFPLFWYEKIDERLSTDDADYVETIQTNAGILGFKYPIGKVSFYPNWGVTQKGCQFDWSGACSHARAYLYFAESILEHNFCSHKQCESLDNLLMKNCTVNLNKNIKIGSLDNRNNVEGIFYIKTNSKPPFGRIN